MSGHSKWHSIKHKKAATDAKRGKAFTQIANLIAVAARQGGSDPEMNFKLRLAINKAKAVNMPSANIERSIKRGAGELGGAQIEEITYEGIGPSGIGIIIEAATDNRNRTAPEVRTALSKHGGRLADAGSVLYQFDQKGVIRIAASDLETATLDAIEAGAEDVEESEGQLTVYTTKNSLNTVQTALMAAGYEIAESELSYLPKSTVLLTDEKAARQVVKIMDLLDDMDDITNTYANFDIAPEVLEAIEG